MCELAAVNSCGILYASGLGVVMCRQPARDFLIGEPDRAVLSGFDTSGMRDTVSFHCTKGLVCAVLIPADFGHF